MTEQTLHPRSLQILKTLVQKYIEDGQPVGSTTLARESKLMVSSATIRHIMADLEKQGYLVAPHTSAGRVPTTQGYRLFIDHFITVQQPAAAQVSQIQQQLDPDCGAKLLAQRASGLLSGITQLTGIVTVPKLKQTVLRHVEFLPLSGCRILVILVLNDHDVQNRVIHTQREYSRAELEQAGNYITSRFLDQDLLNVREKLLAQLKRDRSEFETMLSSVISVAEEVRANEAEQDYVIEGEANLFGAIPEQNIDNLKKLFEAFSHKRDLLHLLDQSMQAQGLKIFVGEESGYDVLGRYSVITAPYTADGKVVGVLGVVGPRRMNYDNVVSAVDITAKLLSNAFNLQQEDAI